jgi:hypothetical protein
MSMFKTQTTRARACAAAVSTCAAMSFALLSSGCNVQQNLIDHVAFQPSSDLSTISVALVFTSNIQTTMNGLFNVEQYGQIFVDGYTSAQPFEVGFTLNTAIFNDQNYVKLTPTAFLPNGSPNGIGYPMAEISPVTPITSVFNLYGYVDILHQSWLGLASIFSFINNQYFPNGLSLSEAFLTNSTGAPGLIASVFGPTVDNQGNMTQAGGISIFANVRQLIAGHLIRAGETTIVRPSGPATLSGERAAEFAGHPAKLRQLQEQLISAFNSQR